MSRTRSKFPNCFPTRIAAGVRGDVAADLGAAAADWIGRSGGEGNRLEEGGWDGKVSEKSLGMKVLGLFSYQEEADLARSRTIGVAQDGKNSRSRHKRRRLDVQCPKRKAKMEIPVDNCPEVRDAVN
jgi:hypothetical protein